MCKTQSGSNEPRQIRTYPDAWTSRCNFTLSWSDAGRRDALDIRHSLIIAQPNAGVNPIIMKLSQKSNIRISCKIFFHTFFLWWLSFQTKFAMLLWLCCLMEFILHRFASYLQNVADGIKTLVS